LCRLWAQKKAMEQALKWKTRTKLPEPKKRTKKHRQKDPVPVSERLSPLPIDTPSKLAVHP
jgi:hypothetical protein